MKRVSILIVAMILAGCASRPLPADRSVEELNHEAQVIASWVNLTLEKTPQQLVLISESTIVSPGMDDVLEVDYTPTEAMFKDISINGQPLRVDKSTIAHFQASNSVSQPLTNQLSFAVPHTMLAGKELHSLFQQEDGWKAFGKRYPKSHGYFSFSRVGFNRERTEALLYVEERVGWLHAGGRYVLFRKYDKTWHYIAEQLTWVS